MENISFRVVSFGGFNKDDVMQYIDKINFQTKEIREQNEVLVKRMQSELNEKNSEVDQIRKENNEFNAKKGQSEAKIVELEQENHRLTEMVRLKTSGVDEQVRTLEHEKSELLDQIRKLKEELSVASREKNSYDNVKETLVKLEIDAHIRAKKLKDDAHIEADTTVKKARAQAVEIVQKANEDYAKISFEKNKLVTETKQAVSQIIAESSDRFAKIQEEIMSIHVINSNVNSHLAEFNENFSKILVETVCDEGMGE